MYKNINFRRYNILKKYNYIEFFRFILKKINKIVSLSNLNFKKISNIRKINLLNLIKYFNFKKPNFLIKYFSALTIFIVFLYLLIPTFYNYDKSKIAKYVCKNNGIECLIKGKVSYSFIPTPRIKVKNLIIFEKKNKQKALLETQELVIKISIKNLINKEQQIYKKIKVNDFEINLNLKNSKNYKSIFSKKSDLPPLNFENGNIIFFDGKDYIATIKKVDASIKANENVELKGKFLNDIIFLKLNKKKKDKKFLTEIELKMKKLNFLTEVSYYNSENDKNIYNSNVLIKKGKNKLTGIFDYKDSKIIINKSNLRNPVLDGRLSGSVEFLPYFNFDLDLALNSLNFTSLYNSFLGLSEENKKSLFKINKKINGKLIISSNKIYSKNSLAKSFESQVKFNNGNISVDQFIVNLGKLGAADLVGVINNEKKLTNFKYESNIFIENEKKFLSKFSIYKKKKLASNYFISGNFNLEKIKNTFYEISYSDNEKIKNNDIEFIESEFNDLLLMEGYRNLFNFSKFKEFIKSTTNEIN